jgi:uncharacterized protein YukE
VKIVSDLPMPPGDPAAIEDAAAAIGRYAVQVGDLAAATHRTMTGVVAGGEWTGSAVDAYTVWTRGLVRGVAGMEEPFAQVPRAVAGYAAALRTAQARVGEYNDCQQRAAAFQGPVSPAMSSSVQAGLQALRAYAEDALTALDQAADAAGRALNSIAETLDHVFGASGPFRAWLENVTRPWDAAAADAILEVLEGKGEEAEKAAEWAREGLPEELAKTMNEMLKAPLSEAAARTNLADAAASGDLQELDAILERWQNLRGAAQAFTDDWGAETSPLLARLLPGLKGLGAAADAATVIGGVYTMISPPEYDGGNLRAIDRVAGGAAAFGGAAGLAVTAGVDFSALSIGAFGLSFVPVAGQVLAVGAGLYLAGDWAYHHTHQIAHAFDTARHTAAHYADDVGHAASTGLSDITDGIL